MPTNGLSIKPLKVKLSAVEQKATELKAPFGFSPTFGGFPFKETPRRLDCYWVGSLDFNFLEHFGVSTKPQRSEQLFAGGSTATKKASGNSRLLGQVTVWIGGRWALRSASRPALRSICEFIWLWLSKPFWGPICGLGEFTTRFRTYSRGLNRMFTGSTGV